MILVTHKSDVHPRPNRQIRPTVDFDSPDLRAIEARDQWVAAAGLVRELSCTYLITLGIENPEEDNAARGEPNA